MQRLRRKSARGNKWYRRCDGDEEEAHVRNQKWSAEGLDALTSSQVPGCSRCKTWRNMDAPGRFWSRREQSGREHPGNVSDHRSSAYQFHPVLRFRACSVILCCAYSSLFRSTPERLLSLRRTLSLSRLGLHSIRGNSSHI